MSTDPSPGEAMSRLAEETVPLDPAFDMIGGPECPTCLGLGFRCHPDGGLIGCAEGCERCDKVVEDRARALGPVVFTDEGAERIAVSLGLLPAAQQPPDPLAEGAARVLDGATRYVELVAKIQAAYREIVMDTDEERALHARHIEIADRALGLARDGLAELGDTTALLAREQQADGGEGT